MTIIKKSAFALLAATILWPLAAQAQSLTPLHSFHLKGKNPWSSLINIGSHLFGTTILGGSSNLGTVYRVLLSGGTAELTLKAFTGSPDGQRPFAALTKVGSTFYATTQDGGIVGGTVFKINTNASSYAV